MFSGKKWRQGLRDELSGSAHSMSNDLRSNLHKRAASVTAITQMAARHRITVLVVELVLTILMAFALLFFFLSVLGHDDSPLGVLHLTVACTIFVYAAMEGGSAFVRSQWFRKHIRSPYEAHASAWQSDDDADGEGWEVVDDLKRGPFAMTPPGTRKSKVVRAARP
ncbi:hypothetical protein HMN09_00556600 [Mycena chlorophos]|uniref:Uncharacterized protein n=1 Tax=Mycena chlorophos TaxID=658473 RepID=A0A8H6WEU1_MYCCL|nr:hypothetical protein HMN09_00556600 [Mycena chlorophos]